MSFSVLDPKTALIVIDLQKGVVALPAVHPIDGVISNVRTMAAAFREQSLPVVLVNVTGAPAVRTGQPRANRAFSADWAELIPELDRQPQDHAVTKTTPGAFTKTGLEAYLRERGITQLVIAGVATSNGVEVTARQAYELGFNIAFPIDAMTDLDAEAHSYSVTRVFPKIGETGTSEEIITLLSRSA